MSWIVKTCKNKLTNETEYFCYSARRNCYIITKSRSYAHYLRDYDVSGLLSIFSNNYNEGDESENTSNKELFKNNFMQYKKIGDNNNKIVNRFKNELFLESAHACIWAISSICNLKCTYCYNEGMLTSPQKIPSREELFDIARALVEGSVGEVALGGGEPLMLGNVIWEICDFLLDNNMRVALLTNTLPMDDEDFLAMNSLINKKKGRFSVTVSLDGHTSDIHSLTRGEGFETIIENMKKLRKNNIPFHVETVLTNRNINFIEEMCKLADEVGALGIIFMKLGPCVSVDKFYDLVPAHEDEIKAAQLIEELKEQYWGFDIIDFEIKFPYWHTNGKIMDCLIAGVFSCYINPYGTVFPCTAAIADEFALGNLHKSSLRDIWKNSKDNAYVQMLQRKTETLAGCSQCEFAQSCNSGCRGEALFLYNDLEARPYRCRKRLIEVGASVEI